MKYNLTNLLYCFSFLLISITSMQLSAQESSNVIRGQVLDASDKLPLPGATVIEQDAEKRTVTGVITDFDGNFAIRVKNTNNQLVISTLGYKTKTIAIGNQKNIIVNMEVSVEGLDEVVITAKKASESGLLNIAERNLTTSAVTIKAQDVENTQAASIDEALQGRVPGVDITATSGDLSCAYCVIISSKGLPPVSCCGACCAACS